MVWDPNILDMHELDTSELRSAADPPDPQRDQSRDRTLWTKGFSLGRIIPMESTSIAMADVNKNYCLQFSTKDSLI